VPAFLSTFPPTVLSALNQKRRVYKARPREYNSSAMIRDDNSLNALVKIGENPLAEARKRAEGRRAVACVLTDAPVEILHAAGLYPVTLFGHRGPPGSGARHLQSFACSYSRAVLDLLLDGEADFAEGVVTPFICDTTRAIDFTIRHLKPVPFVECYRPPKSLTGRGSRDYTIGELGRLRESLAKFAGSPISEEALDASIKLFNRARAQLRRIEPLRETDPDSFYKVCRAFMTIPVGEFVELAESVESPSGEKADGVPVLVAGKVMEPGDLPEVLAGIGFRIVADDLATGARLYSVDVDETLPPLEALADRQLNNIPFVGLLQGPEDRPDFLIRRYTESEARGVIMMTQKFCEPFEIDAPEVRERLKGENIPVLTIETDYELSVPGALRTRLEAFLEMIENG